MNLLIVIFLVFLETSVYVDFPYNAVALSYSGYIIFTKEYFSLPYLFLIGFVVGLSGYHVERPIVFFLFLFVILRIFYKFILFQGINIFIITLIEVILYLLYINFFEYKLINLYLFVKEFIFVYIMNFIFYKLEFEKR
ncbi:MAG: hypothetical protein PWP46_1511 [Fusobacteriaceae bacterium]|jgi:hypothetical protein|nr:hypothetical protein [Fusobacteriales bacterium]MDN5304625.1 hypothetical protein [Fusobacteriaceae bacterium]